MNTSRSTGCVASSSRREMPGVSPSCELFQGTITSDLGASSLPRIDMPDMVTSPSAVAFAGAAGLPAGVLAAAVALLIVGLPASLAGRAAGSAAPAPDASSASAKVVVIRWRMQLLPPAGAGLQIGNP